MVQGSVRWKELGKIGFGALMGDQVLSLLGLEWEGLAREGRHESLCAVQLTGIRFIFLLEG